VECGVTGQERGKIKIHGGFEELMSAMRQVMAGVLWSSTNQTLGTCLPGNAGAALKLAANE